jgi:hypothetical protein
MLEKAIEKKVCDYAKSRGVYVRKFTSPSQRSVPDRIFLFPNGRVVFVEFKQKGKFLTPAQHLESLEIRERRGLFKMIDDEVEGKAWVNSMLVSFA